MCKDLFCAFVEEGESVNTNKAFVHYFSLCSYDQTKLKLEIYFSPKSPVWYISDDGVKKLTVELEGALTDMLK